MRCHERYVCIRTFNKKQLFSLSSLEVKDTGIVEDKSHLCCILPRSRKRIDAWMSIPAQLYIIYKHKTSPVYTKMRLRLR